MTAPPSRRFTIADGMVIVVAAAVAVLLARDYYESLFVVHKRASAERLVWAIQGMTTCIASPCMLALIPIRLRRPRPPYRRLVRQPGFAACSAIAALLVLGSLECMTLLLFRDVSKAWGTWPFQQLWHIAAVGRGPFAVAGAWLLLAISGRWRPEASWVDRLGCALGLVWVVWLPIGLAQPWLLELLPAF
jgi:hypothetical protein